MVGITRSKVIFFCLGTHQVREDEKVVENCAVGLVVYGYGSKMVKNLALAPGFSPKSFGFMDDHVSNVGP
jgi:hypothetical protein